METILEKLSSQEKAIAAVGTTVAQTDQLLTDLEMLESTAEVKMKYLTLFSILKHKLRRNSPNTHLLGLLVLKSGAACSLIAP